GISILSMNCPHGRFRWGTTASDVRPGRAPVAEANLRNEAPNVSSGPGGLFRIACDVGTTGKEAAERAFKAERHQRCISRAADDARRDVPGVGPAGNLWIRSDSAGGLAHAEKVRPGSHHAAASLWRHDSRRDQSKRESRAAGKIDSRRNR